MSEKKILLVDADAASRNFIARQLLDRKYEVVQVSSGREGLICAWRDHPDIAIIDPTTPDLAGEEIARKLKQDLRTANMPLVALTSDSSVARMKSCLDAGFNEYIIKSGQAVSMLSETINRLLGMQVATIKEGGLLLVFLSAKGGVGTSSLCANIATNISLIQPEARIAVIDLVLPIGSIAPIVGYHGMQNIVTATELTPAETTPDILRQQMIEMKTWRFHLLAGSPDPESSNRLKVGRIWDIVAAIKPSYDYVLVDIGRSLSRITLPLIQNADLVTMIVSSDLSAVSMTKTLFDYLHAKGVNAKFIYALLNRAVGLEGLSKAEVEKILDTPINSMLPYLGSNFTFTNNHHQPFTVKFPNDTASFIFKEIAKDVSSLARKLRAG